MAECTFSPRVVVSNAAKRYKEKLGNRTGKSFTRAQDQFLAKKEQWLEQQRREQLLREKEMQAKQFMSKGSKKVMRDASRTMDGSQKSNNTFLQRNYNSKK